MQALFDYVFVIMITILHFTNFLYQTNLLKRKLCFQETPGSLTTKSASHFFYLAKLIESRQPRFFLKRGNK